MKKEIRKRKEKKKKNNKKEKKKNKKERKDKKMYWKIVRENDAMKNEKCEPPSRCGILLVKQRTFS